MAENEPSLPASFSMIEGPFAERLVQEALAMSRTASLPSISFNDEANELWEQQIHHMADHSWMVKLTFDNGNEIDAFLRHVERDRDGMPVLCYVEPDEQGLEPADDAPVIRLTDPTVVKDMEVY